MYGHVHVWTEDKDQAAIPWLAAKIRSIWMPSERHQELWASVLCATGRMRHWARRRLALQSADANIHQRLRAKTDFGPTPLCLGILVVVLGSWESWSFGVPRLVASLGWLQVIKSDSVPSLGTVCAVDLHQRVAGLSSSPKAKPCQQ